MKERPILFSTPMVQAILGNNKTMTRRIIKEKSNKPFIPDYIWDLETILKHNLNFHDYGKPGDILWVRETWRKADFQDFDGIYEFRASLDNPNATWNSGIWKPSIHMPKGLARIWLQIVSIKPERLHDISDSDIVAEGVRIPVNGIGTGKVLLALGEKNTAIDFLPAGCLAPDAPKLTQSQLLHAFWAELWCKVNGRESWDKNPWVWAIEFKVLSTTGKPSDI